MVVLLLIPHTTYESSSYFTFPPVFSNYSLFNFNHYSQYAVISYYGLFFLTVPFKENFFFYFDEVQFIMSFFLMIYDPYILFRKSLPNKMSQRFFSFVFPRHFIISAFTLSYRIHFKEIVLFIVWGKIGGSFFFHIYIQLFQLHLLKKLFSPPLNYFGNLTI